MKFFHHALWGIIAYMSAGFVMIAYFPQVELGLHPTVTILLGMAAFLLASGKIITYEYRKMLFGKAGMLRRKPYCRTVPGAYFGLLAVSAVYSLLVDMQAFFMGGHADGIATEELLQQRQDATVHMIVLVLGCLFLWKLFWNQLITGADRAYGKTLKSFAKNYLSVYLLYRLIIFLLTLAGSLLMGAGKGDAQNSYFLFALDDAVVQSAATGFIGGSGTFFSGVTAASSFFVLTVLAEESIRGSGGASFMDRLRRMFLEVDTVKLLLMTVICILISQISSGGDFSLLDLLLNTVLILLWLASSILFLADTGVVDYLIDFTVLGLIERLIPVPEVGGFGGFLLALLMTVIRIGLFSAVAVMIANYRIHRKQQMAYRAVGQNQGKQRLGSWLRNLTFLQVIVLIESLAEMVRKAHNKDEKVGQAAEEAVFVVNLARKVDDFIEGAIEKLSPESATSGK